jgi:predicted restriction endonuclease
MKRRNWTRDELILAFNLYCKIPFGSMHSKNPKVIGLSNIIGRSPNAVALKLSNFASFDPNLKSRGIKGMRNAGKKDEEVWREFTNNWEDLIFESEKLLTKFQNIEIDPVIGEQSPTTHLIGEDKNRTVKTRVNQSFFRQIILSNYYYKCAICDLNIQELLIAGHIVPWSIDKNERLNPQNGICLCSLHDKAFDTGLIGIDISYKVLISEKLSKMEGEQYFKMYFGNFKNKQINLPEKFLPHIEFIQFHLDNIFLE